VLWGDRRLVVMAGRRVLVGSPNIAWTALAVPGIASLRLARPAGPDVVASGVVDAAAHAGQAKTVRRE
jgi:uncharacterized membrane protein